MSINLLHGIDNQFASLLLSGLQMVFTIFTWCQIWYKDVRYNIRSGQIIIKHPSGQTIIIFSPSPAWFMVDYVSPMKYVSKKLTTFDCFKVYNEQPPAPLLPGSWLAKIDAEKSHPARSQGDHRYLISQIISITSSSPR